MALHDLIENPARVAELTREDAAQALAELKGLESGLLLHLVTVAEYKPVAPPKTDSLEMLCPRQIADMSGLTQQRVYGLIQSGELKAKKTGKYWRVRRVDFERWQMGESVR